MLKLSRTGNDFKSLVSGISDILLGSQSGCLVRMTRCDVASSEEAGATLQPPKESVAVIHAGGVEPGRYWRARRVIDMYLAPSFLS